MNYYDGLLLLQAFFFILALCIYLYGCFYFKKNSEKYDAIVSELKSKGLQLDVMTNFSSNLGCLFNGVKIIFFIRLYYGKKWYYKKHQLINPETYFFIQTLPLERIGWVIKLHKINILSYVFTAIFLIVALIWRIIFF